MLQSPSTKERTLFIYFSKCERYYTFSEASASSVWSIPGNGVKMHFMDQATAAPVVSQYCPKLRDHGTTFIGTEGWVTVRRGAIDFSDEMLRRVKLKEDEIHLYKSEDHMGNFIECIKTRKKPASTIEAAIQSDLISHLSNAVVRLNRPIKWDPKNEKIVDDQQATEMLNRPMRSPWTL